MSTKKPPPLKEYAVTNERLKNIFRKIAHASNGLVYVYTWNLESTKNPPLGLFTDAEYIKTACEALDEIGGKRTELKDGAIQFDLTDACGVPGNHMVFYKTGKILVTASEKGNSKNSSITPKFDFFKSVLIDIIEAMSKSIKGHIESTEREETGIKVPVVPQDRETPVNNFPVMLKNVIPQVIKSNPKELAALIEKCKPNASIKEIRVLSKGDIRVVGQTPHDYAILQQPWPKTDYGDLTPALPDSNTVDQAVLVFGVPLSIDIGEIEDHLNNRALFPKEIVRFKKPQSIEPSTTVKVVFGSSQLKERILSEGFNVYHHIYRVVSYEKDPVIQQCF